MSKKLTLGHYLKFRGESSQDFASSGRVTNISAQVEPYEFLKIRAQTESRSTP